MSTVVGDPLLKVGTVADLLGYSQKHVYALARQGKFRSAAGYFYFCDEPIKCLSQKTESKRLSIKIFQSGYQHFVESRSIKTRTFKEGN